MNTLEMLGNAVAKGGGTYRITGLDDKFEALWEAVEHDFGYFVAAPGGVENLPAAALSVNTVNAIVDARHFYSGYYLGLWQDEHGNWSIDETEWINDRNLAEIAGRANQQRAIWDLAENKEVVL